MRIESQSVEVRQARKAALELLLSDHLGDCIAPCQNTCPAGMNIPLMIRQISAGDMRGAITTVKEDIALPAVLGRICPAPCEKGCRRAAYDSAVAICTLKRYVADVDLANERSYLPVREPTKNKKVAIVGAGPAGLAAAFYLLRKGYACTIFDEHKKAGGMLRYGVSENKLPRNVLDAEIALIEKLGAEFCLAKKIPTDPLAADLKNDFDAVLIATGQGKSYQGSATGVFTAGDVARARKLAVWAVADGKAAADSIEQYLSGLEVTGRHRPFNVHIGRLQKDEIAEFMAGASPAGRVELPGDSKEGLTAEQARKETARCLRCDCRKLDECKLRRYSDMYDAKPSRYKGQQRRFEQQLQHSEVIYEPGKCINCGLCVMLTAKASEELGLTFIGRGFDVRIAVPFGKSLDEGLKKTATECVTACPTGAIAFKDSLSKM
jgi:NADPH-dependent glutamate synthase beta subunit-like oxidoreductase/ferredoxin